MKTIELRHNPFLETTILNIDGKEAHLNCLGTGEGHRLQEWKDEFFPQMIKKINIGPGSACAVVFFGIQEDYHLLQAAHAEFSNQHNDIKVILDYGIKPPITLTGKQDTLKRLMEEACNEPFGGEEMKDRCDGIRKKEFPPYIDDAGKLKDQAKEFTSLILEQDLPGKIEQCLAAAKNELEATVAKISGAKRLGAEGSTSSFYALEQNLLKGEQELLQRGYDETIALSEEKTPTSSVILDGFNEDKKIAVIKVVRKAIGFSLAETLKFIEHTPIPLKENIYLEEANKIRMAIHEAGGNATVHSKVIDSIEVLKQMLISRYCNEIKTLFSDPSLSNFNAVLPCDIIEISKQFSTEIIEATSTDAGVNNSRVSSKIPIIDAFSDALTRNKTQSQNLAQDGVKSIIDVFADATDSFDKLTEQNLKVNFDWGGEFGHSNDEKALADKEQTETPQYIFTIIKTYFESELAKVNESLKVFIAEEKVKQAKRAEPSGGDHETEKARLENDIAALEDDIVRANSLCAEVNALLNI